MSRSDLFTSLLLGAVLQAGHKAVAGFGPEMPAVLPDGVHMADKLRIIRSDVNEAQCLVRRIDDDRGRPCLRLLFAGVDQPDGECQLSYNTEHERDVDFFNFNADMVREVVAHLARAEREATFETYVINSPEELNALLRQYGIGH